jgi:hypothetical protein
MQFSEIVKGHIEKMACPVHDIHPVVEQDWEGVKIITCCSDFHTGCMEQAEKLMSNASKSSDIESA